MKETKFEGSNNVRKRKNNHHAIEYFWFGFFDFIGDYINNFR